MCDVKKNKKKNSSESLSLMYSKLGRVMGGRCTQTSHHLRQKQWLMWRPAVINLSGVVRAINGHSTTNGRAMPRLMRPSTFSSVLSATASGAHPHPPTHVLHRTVMSPGLMHRTTQLERKKNVSLPSRAKAFACTGEFTVSVWILKSKPDQPRIYIVSYCVRVCGVTRRSQTELTAPARSPLTCGLMASYKTPVLFCASSFFLLWHGNVGSSPRNTQEPHTHTHTWICSSMPHLVWGLSWLRGRKNCFLQ